MYKSNFILEKKLYLKNLGKKKEKTQKNINIQKYPKLNVKR